MNSKALNEAIALTEKKPLPNDIIAQLDHLRFNIDPLEDTRFGWLYEGVYLEFEGRVPDINEDEK